MDKDENDEIVELLTNTKINVGIHSAEIQRYLFKLGFGWRAGKRKVVKNEDIPFLFLTKTKIYGSLFITCCEDEDYFNEHPFREIDLGELLLLFSTSNRNKKIGKSILTITKNDYNN